MESCIGFKACGACCYVIYHLLKKENIITKMIKKTNGYCDDHCFLMYENIIIDPTYKQFFIDSVYKEPNSFTEYLLQHPFVFIGTFDEFNNHYIEMNILYKKKYFETLDVTPSDYWKCGTQHTELLLDENHMLSINVNIN